MNVIGVTGVPFGVGAAQAADPKRGGTAIFTISDDPTGINRNISSNNTDGLIACIVIWLVALYGAELLAHVPTAALAGVLLFVAGRIFRIGEMRDILGKTWSEFALVVVTLLLVVILPVQTGVALAIMLSLIHGVFTTTRARLIEYERLPRSSVWWPESPRIAGEKLEGVVVASNRSGPGTSDHVPSDAERRRPAGIRSVDPHRLDDRFERDGTSGRPFVAEREAAPVADA